MYWVNNSSYQIRLPKTTLSSSSHLDVSIHPAMPFIHPPPCCRRMKLAGYTNNERVFSCLLFFVSSNVIKIGKTWRVHKELGILFLSQSLPSLHSLPPIKVSSGVMGLHLTRARVHNLNLQFWGVWYLF